MRIIFILKYWLEVIFGLVITILTCMIKQIKNYKKILNTTSKGVVVLLKTKIIERYDILIKKDAISIAEKQSILDIYNVYKELDQCTVIDGLIKKLDSIPIK